jgi:hypothetical protein
VGTHPANLAFRFLAEMTVLVAVGWWAWTSLDGAARIVVAIGLPLLLAALWGTFGRPDDPSRGGRPPVVVPGWARLLIEILFFAAGAAALWALASPLAGLVFAILVAIHYVLWWDRVRWLLGRTG